MTFSIGNWSRGLLDYRIIKTSTSHRLCLGVALFFCKKPHPLYLLSPSVLRAIGAEAQLQI
jgi:hypothetical protein